MKIIAIDQQARTAQIEVSDEEIMDLSLIFGITMTSPEAPLLALLFGMKHERVQGIAKAFSEALITLGPPNGKGCGRPDCPACKKRAEAMKRIAAGMN